MGAFGHTGISHDTLICTKEGLQAVSVCNPSIESGYSLELDNGQTLAGAPGQQVLVLHPDLKMAWRPLSSLVPGEYVAIATHHVDWPDDVALPPPPASMVKSTMRSDPLICCECGKSVKQLARHIQMGHKMTTVDYTKKYNHTGPWTSFVARTTQPKLATYPTHMSESLAMILGYLVSEGGVIWIKDTYNVGFSSTYVDSLDEYEIAFQDVFSRTSTRTGALGEIGSLRSLSPVGAPIYQRKYFYRTYCYSKPIGEFLLAVAGAGVAGDAGNKVVPWSVMQSSKTSIAAFLRALYLGDGSGYFRNPSQSKWVSISYHSKSRKLILDVQLLLLRFGIKSKISKQYTKNVLTFSGKHQVYTFMKEVMGVDCPTLIEHWQWHDMLPYVRSILCINSRENVNRNGMRTDTRAWLKTTDGSREIEARLDVDQQARLRMLIDRECAWIKVKAIEPMDGIRITRPSDAGSPIVANGILTC